MSFKAISKHFRNNSSNKQTQDMIICRSTKNRCISKAFCMKVTRLIDWQKSFVVFIHFYNFFFNSFLLKRFLDIHSRKYSICVGMLVSPLSYAFQPNSTSSNIRADTCGSSNCSVWIAEAKVTNWTALFVELVLFSFVEWSNEKKMLKWKRCVDIVWSPTTVLSSYGRNDVILKSTEHLQIVKPPQRTKRKIGKSRDVSGGKSERANDSSQQPERSICGQSNYGNNIPRK